MDEGGHVVMWFYSAILRRLQALVFPSETFRVPGTTLEDVSLIEFVSDSSSSLYVRKSAPW